jgi:negative regulator of replication initiation
MRAGTPTDAARTTAAMRDRVTVDLRGIRPQLQAQAAKRQMTAAALVRHAVAAMLDDAQGNADESGSIDGAIGTQVVKVTLRLPVAHAVVLASRARVADVSQGSYVARLIDCTPAQPLAPDHIQAVAALMASTDRLAALSADLNAFMRLLGRTPRSELEPYRASIRSLAGDVRVHLASAATLVAALRATRGKR